MKRILFIANYFYPDVASTGQLLTDLCSEIKGKFDIMVIAAIPNYSENIIINNADKNKKFYYEKVKGINVCRIIVPNVNKTSKISRVKYIVKYYFNTKSAIRNIENYDIVFTISQPPILGGLLGKYAKQKYRKAKLIYNIQDFNPEQIEAVKYSKFKLLIKLLRKLDNTTLKFSDKIVLVGSDQLETIKCRNNVYKDKCVIINNWINEKEIFPLNKNDIEVLNFKKEFNLLNKFVVMYSGNIGLFYDLENLVKVAEKFRENKDIVFTFVGDGAKKSELESYKYKNSLNNIVFIPYQPKDKLNISLNAADVHLVVNAKGIKGVSVPSKIYGVLASGKYVIGVLEEESEARLIIEKAKCGKCTEPKSYGEFQKLIEEAYSNKKNIDDIGKNGRMYLESNLKMDYAIKKYESIFNQLS